MRIAFIVFFVFIVGNSKAGEYGKSCKNCLDHLKVGNSIIKEFEEQYKEIKTISATFKQVSEDNSVITGEFYLKKPNKIIWKYLKPYPVIILINGNVLTYYDQKLDEISYKNVKDSIFSVILGKNSNLSSKIISTSIKGSLKQITFKDQFLDEPFTLRFFFTSSPFILKKLSLNDSNQELSNITFTNFHKNVAIDDKKFTISRKFLKRN